jgi:hypothetical protein
MKWPGSFPRVHYISKLADLAQAWHLTLIHVVRRKGGFQG